MAQPRVVDAGQWSLPGLALLSYGFRPFFLFGAAVAALVVPAWLLMLAQGFEPAGPFSALRWHAHEMIFGYLAAIIAGFALTAIPNWTGRLPLSGLPLAFLVALWLIGRVASLAVASPVWAMVLDGAFLIVLAAAVWREIIAGRNLRNAPVALIIALFASANLLFHLEWAWPQVAGYGERLALGLTIVLIGLIGGRIIPSFTRNWMVRKSIDSLPVPFAAYDKAVIALTIPAVLGWVLLPGNPIVGAGLVLAGLLHCARLMRWRGLRARREPIVLVLHLGYFWLALSLVLLGLAALAPQLFPPSMGLHALGAGAIGTMTLAVMTRASLGHTGREVASSPANVAIFVLVTAGAFLRVAAPALPGDYLALLAAGGMLWSAAFGTFAIAYAGILLTPGRGRV